MKGNENAVIEYRYLLNTYYAVQISLMFFVFLFVFSLLEAPSDFIIPQQDVITGFLSYGVLVPVFVCLESYRWRLPYDEEFNYYFAKACFTIILEKEDTVQKMRYLILGTCYYDKYLRENLKRRIRDIEEIYSRILSDPTLDRNKTTELIIEAFNSDDKLKAIACLSSILTDVKKEQFLVKGHFGSGLITRTGLLGILPILNQSSCCDN